MQVIAGLAARTGHKIKPKKKKRTKAATTRCLSARHVCCFYVFPCLLTLAFRDRTRCLGDLLGPALDRGKPYICLYIYFPFFFFFFFFFLSLSRFSRLSRPNDNQLARSLTSLFARVFFSSSSVLSIGFYVIRFYDD